LSIIHPDITVGPPVVTISDGFTVLVTEPDGGIRTGSDKGLFFRDTRLISSYEIMINGDPWELINAAATVYYSSHSFLTNNAFVDDAGDVPAKSISLQLGRSVGAGLHEDYDLTNHCQRRVRFQLELKIESDFADIFEVRAGARSRRGRTQTYWSASAHRLVTTYVSGGFRRGLSVSSTNADSIAQYANGRLIFEIELDAGMSWHVCIAHAVNDGDEVIAAPLHCIENIGAAKSGRRLSTWVNQVTKIESSNEDLYRLFRRGVEDIAALRLPFAAGNDMNFVPAGGIPWFAALFGRDSLIASLQTLHIHPQFARGTLAALAETQALQRDDYRDAEPGKIAHELRQGELALLKKIPHTPYYGSADSTPLYLILLHDAWRWTGDLDLLSAHLETAERCLAWIDHDGDRDGDGFQEYGTRSAKGYENQGWKDSGDAVLDADGRNVQAPKALCELQGYVYDAWLRMSSIYDALGDDKKAETLRLKAAALYRAFNQTFWDEALGFYVFGLDADKRPIRTIASNAGHCLWSGIVPADRAARVVDRLMAEDMWSGWGIRTLSARHPAFNPLSYHNGSVWPHDNAIIAMGFKRYGFAAEASKVSRGLSDAASYFASHRLPELFAGVQRTATNFPVQYLGANVPQAWSAGAVFFLLSAILGLMADAPVHKLYVDPALPPWLPDITVSDLTVGAQKLSIRFWRDGDETLYKVLQGEASMVERRPARLYGA
jgi:glycogen debranching enzyme